MFNIVEELVEFMPMSSIVEMFGSGNSEVPFYRGNQYGIPKTCFIYKIKSFRVCFENGRIVYKIYV